MTAGPVAEQSIIAEASSITDIQNQIKDTQNQISEINEQIDKMSEEQELVQEKIEDLNAEIINTMTSIGMKEDAIAEKKIEISDKQVEIDETQAAYEEAKAREEKQHDDMLTRIRRMYEKGDPTLLSLLLEGNGLSDALNHMDYIEMVYEYDRKKLEEYEATKNQVHDLWDQLETEKAQLETDKAQLEADREALKNQKANLDSMLDRKKQESANYDAEIRKARQDAAVYKQLLQQEQKELKRLQQQNQQTKPGNTAAASATYTPTDQTATINNSSGSDLGKKVAQYACQYVGNPYVAGGTSLTNGADCSGFTYRVYSDFGYSLPRTSYEQRSAGTEVSYSDAQPGDLICYDGHVALYIGGGKIVHASTPSSGIKIGNANYRTILSVRRIV